MKVNKGILLAFLIVLFSQLIRTFFCEDLPSALIELMQEYIVILPVGLFAIYKNNNGRINTPVYPISNWVDVYYYTVIVSSLCVLFQYFLYFFTGTRIGYTTIWQGRQVFDLLFTGYSVLSIFLGGGILIALYKLLDGENMFFHLITLLIIGFSAAINSSRSGLLSAIVIMILLFINAIFRKKKLRYVFAYSIPVIISMWYIVTFLINHRESLQSGRLFFANNRDFVMRYALQSMSDNVIYFLFGTGINGAKIHGVSQHNMFLEMWYLNGTIFIIPFIILIFAILFITRRKNTWFLLWHIILGHQFISSFFATTFLVPILLIVLCSSESDYYLNSHTYDGSLVNT